MFTDARVAAPLDSEHWISSPNANYIPAIPFHHVEVRARFNGFYATADPVQWPQAFESRYAFLSVIPRTDHLPAGAPKTAITLDPSDPEYCDQMGSYTSDGEPLVKFHTAKASILTTASEQIRSDMERFLVDEADSVLSIAPNAHTPPDLHAFLMNLVVTIGNMAIVVREVPMSLNEYMTTIRTFQRSYLEALAYMDYVRTYMPRMSASRSDGRATHPVNLHVMGAYTTDPRVVARLYRAGIPVWYIRTYMQLHEGLIIQSVVAPQQPDDTITTEAQPRCPTLYTGPPGIQQLDAVHVFNADTHQKASLPRPFADPDVASPSRSRSPDAPAASSSTSNKRARVEGQPRATGKIRDHAVQLCRPPERLYRLLPFPTEGECRPRSLRRPGFAQHPSSHPRVVRRPQQGPE